MTTYHILNGDCLAGQLSLTTINQDFIVCRECLIEGEVYAPNLSEFWAIRKNFFNRTYQVLPETYFNHTVLEFEKLNKLPANSEVCLWFEHDLFCQTNMWFIISVLANKPAVKICRIFPIAENVTDTWKGFGIASNENLEQAYASRIEFTPADIELGKNLWTAYQNGNLDELSQLAKSPSNCFKYLDEVCRAHIERFPSENTLGRPERVIKEIIENRSKEFQTVFSEFTAREGIYGFGDLQVKSLFDKQLADYK